MFVVFAVLAFTEAGSEKEAEMAMESLLAQGLATVFVAGLARYATTHRAEDKKDQDHHRDWLERGSAIAVSQNCDTHIFRFLGAQTQEWTW